MIWFLKSCSCWQRVSEFFERFNKANEKSGIQVDANNGFKLKLILLVLKRTHRKSRRVIEINARLPARDSDGRKICHHTHHLLCLAYRLNRPDLDPYLRRN